MTENSVASPIEAVQADLELCIQKVATGPEYSKDLSFEEARAGMSLILSGRADPVQAAVVLIALRMKRETTDENRGVMQAIIDTRLQVTSEAAEIVDLSDPYNGQIRGLPVVPFIAPVLSACGIPAFCQGLEIVGPKYGITLQNVLAAAKVNVDKNSTEVARDLNNADIGWGYLDQKHYCPALHDLVGLRNKMIKRTVITTLEVLTRPIAGKLKTHLITGYVHKAYPPVYADLARFAGYDSAAIVRGVEGGLMPSLRQPARFYCYRSGQEDEFIDLDPATLGITEETRAIPLPNRLKSLEDGDATAKENAIATAARIGIAALQNEKGIARNSIIYGAAISLFHLQKFETLAQAAEAADKAISSGDAYDKFSANLSA
ncbi:MAG: anthranilate phosphoribosyltransferase [Planctomycetota bacterium]|jgi:anthranilate phosphoribosyltransferase